MSLKPIMEVLKWSNKRTQIKITIKNEAIIHSFNKIYSLSFNVMPLLMIFHFNICAYVLD